MKKRPFILGTYPLGHENVELWIEDEDDDGCGGGWFQLQGPNGGRPHIHILIPKKDNWPHILQVLLHESREFLSARMGLRFVESSTYLGNPAAYVFHYDHQQMAEMDMRQATFISYAFEPLKAVFDERTAPPKPRPKRKRKTKANG